VLRVVNKGKVDSFRERGKSVERGGPGGVKNGKTLVHTKFGRMPRSATVKPEKGRGEKS